jgi:hypothetical protein
MSWRDGALRGMIISIVHATPAIRTQYVQQPGVLEDGEIPDEHWEKSLSVEELEKYAQYILKEWKLTHRRQIRLERVLNSGRDK